MEKKYKMGVIAAIGVAILLIGIGIIINLPKENEEKEETKNLPQEEQKVPEDKKENDDVTIIEGEKVEEKPIAELETGNLVCKWSETKFVNNQYSEMEIYNIKIENETIQEIQFIKKYLFDKKELYESQKETLSSVQVDTKFYDEDLVIATIIPTELDETFKNNSVSDFVKYLESQNFICENRSGE